MTALHRKVALLAPTTGTSAIQSWLVLLRTTVDWTIPLKSQQRDFLLRLKSFRRDSSRNDGSPLIQCQIPGCHREEMVVSGDRVGQLRALCRQLILKSDPSLPVRELFQIYLRQQLVREAIASYCADVLVSTDPIAQLSDRTLADFTIDAPSRLGIRVKGIEEHGEEYGENPYWCWSAREIATSEAIACVLIREPVNEIAEEYHLVLAGFLPSHLVPLQGDEVRVGIEDLLYNGGLRGYLDILTSKPPSVEKPNSDWLYPLMGASSYRYPVAIAADGKTLASCGYDGSIGIWKLDNPELSQILGGRTWSLSPSTSGSGMSNRGSTQNAFEVKLASSGQRHSTIAGHSSGVSTISLTPDGQILIGGGFDGTIEIWHLPSGKLQHSIQAHSGMVKPIAISPDGQILVSGSIDKTIKCWQIERGQCLREFSLQTEPVESLAIRSDGGAVAGGFPDGTLKIWDLETGKLQQTLAGHGGAVRGLLFGEGDRLLASSSIERTVKVWDLQEKSVEQTLTGHPDPFVTIAANPDQQRLELNLLRWLTEKNPVNPNPS